MKKNADSTESNFDHLWSELWLAQIAQIPSSEFERMALESVAHGTGLRKMKDACVELGFMGVPLDYYLTEAAHTARVPLPRLLEPLLKEAGNVWLSLSRLLMLPIEHIRLMSRAMFLQSVMTTAAPVRARRTGTALPIIYQPAMSISEYTSVLDAHELRYDAQQRRMLENLLLPLST